MFQMGPHTHTHTHTHTDTHTGHTHTHTHTLTHTHTFNANRWASLQLCNLLEESDDSNEMGTQALAPRAVSVTGIQIYRAVKWAYSL